MTLWSQNKDLFEICFALWKSILTVFILNTVKKKCELCQKGGTPGFHLHQDLSVGITYMHFKFLSSLDTDIFIILCIAQLTCGCSAGIWVTELKSRNREAAGYVTMHSSFAEESHPAWTHLFMVRFSLYLFLQATKLRWLLRWCTGNSHFLLWLLNIFLCFFHFHLPL